MASESTSSQQSSHLLPSSKVNFKCQEGIIAYNNAVALLEHSNVLYHPMLSFLSNCCISTALTRQPSANYVDYLKEFWYTAKVDEATKTITFSLSLVKNPLSFTQEEFISTTGLPVYENVIPTPSPKEAVRAGLATLGLVDKDNPSLSSFVLVNSSPLKIKFKMGRSIWRQIFVIQAASFQTPLASEVSLTSHMLKVAKLFQQSKQSLILSFEKVNVDDGADKSLSRIAVQPIMNEIDQKNKAALVTPESPFDTKSEIKIIKKFQPTQLDDNAQITFLHAEPSHFEYSLQDQLPKILLKPMNKEFNAFNTLESRRTEIAKMSFDQFSEYLTQTTSSIFSSTPPREPTPPRDESKGKGIATEEPLKDIMPYIEEGGYVPKMPKFKSFITLDEQLTQEDIIAQVKEMKRLADLKSEKEKLEESLKRIVISQAKKLGVPPPPELSTFGILADDKKIKRSSEILQEVFAKENIVVDVMHRNLVPPPGVEGRKGLVIKEPKLLESSPIMGTLI
ncbi:hypothetical protein Tco_0461901 [Tanacetum coccineum]